MKLIIKYLFIILLTIIILFGTGLFYFTLNDYTPPSKEIIAINKNAKIIANHKISLLTWNIGYCGLDKNMDFFYDGGKKVRTTKQQTIANLTAIKTFLKNADSIDIMLLQEVDVNSKRSYGINDLDTFKNLFTNISIDFAKNYDVQFVPVPIKSPMGKVISGQVILSKQKVENSARYSYPVNYSWPTSLFMLDRCFVVNRYKLFNNKYLVVINTHNSAYGDGSMQKKELVFLKSFLLNEYKAGNYIIVGGDWNQNPPNYESKNTKSKAGNFTLVSVDSTLMPADWKWIYDSKTPTNRFLDQCYSPNNETTILDFFLISPNLQAISVKTIDLQFQHSDHNPVIIEVELN